MNVIVAAATPKMRSAIGMVRFSGEELDVVLEKILQPLEGEKLRETLSQRVVLCDQGGIYDDGVLLRRRGPKTYTGEDTAEITCHGNPLILERIIGAAQAAGASIALPGEFTKRAVVNGKFDLVYAEGVNHVCRAHTHEGLELGWMARSGMLRSAFDHIREGLVRVVAELEARLDYPGDELKHDEDDALQQRLRECLSETEKLAKSYQVGRILVDGAKVALVGEVNAGKSSLFNRLVGTKRAIVHDQPGTTRDVVEARIEINGLSVTLLDTAGERKTSDPVEAAGLALARELIADADLLVLVVRARKTGKSPVEDELLGRTADHRRVVVYNGIDLDGVRPADPDEISTSALTGAGVEELRLAIWEVLRGRTTHQMDHMIASARQRDLLGGVGKAIRMGMDAMDSAGVAVSADAITRGIEEIDTLTGADTREDILDSLFSAFCIGK